MLLAAVLALAGLLLLGWQGHQQKAALAVPYSMAADLAAMQKSWSVL